MGMFCAGGEGGDGLAMRSGMLRECLCWGGGARKKGGVGGLFGERAPRC